MCCRRAPSPPPRLHGGQTDPKKRSQLRAWAWASGGWLAFGAVLVVVLASVTLH
jgi:hypothetical protein